MMDHHANGAVHMGHALNKISKDFIVRGKSMSGFRAPYVPGWDTWTSNRASFAER